MNKFPAFNLLDGYLGVFQPDAGTILASKVLEFFQNTAQLQGLRVLSGEKVTSITQQNDFLTISTNSNIFHAKKVIITAGSWINNFFKEFSLSHRTKVQPVNFGYWKVRRNEIFRPSKFPIFISWGEKTFYGFPIIERERYFTVKLVLIIQILHSITG
jgi:glycine/D-amino acid oxidase-like deaminating enzyme